MLGIFCGFSLKYLIFHLLLVDAGSKFENSFSLGHLSCLVSLQKNTFSVTNAEKDFLNIFRLSYLQIVVTEKNRIKTTSKKAELSFDFYLYFYKIRIHHLDVHNDICDVKNDFMTKLFRQNIHTFSLLKDGK